MELQPMQDPWTQRMNTDISRERVNHHQAIVLRIIDLGGTVLLSLLATRFVFMLFGANQASGLVSLVYGFTTPFSLPFSGLFTHDTISYGVSHFEGFTLIAMAFYALIIAGLRRLAVIAWW